MTELTTEQQAARLRVHETEWMRALFDAEINHEVAIELGEADMLKQAKKQTLRAEKALQVIRKKIKELETPNAPQHLSDEPIRKKIEKLEPPTE